MVEPLTPESKKTIEELLERASNDLTFREQLLNKPDDALSSTSLSQSDKEVLSLMRRVALEEWGVDVQKYRAFLRDNGAKMTAY